MKSVYAVATLDTKSVEIGYVASLVRRAGVPVKIVDCSCSAEAPSSSSSVLGPDVTRDEVLSCHPDRSAVAAALSTNDRGKIVTIMSDALREFVRRNASDVSGIISIGGSGGTALAVPCMRELPLGVPKVMVSTMASGDVGPYVCGSDITMVYSVSDVAGVNDVSREVLGNAANAVAGMVQFRTNVDEESKSSGGGDAKVNVGMSMFGVTTPCCDRIRAILAERGQRWGLSCGSDDADDEKAIDAICFHSTGSGGRAMNRLVASGKLEGVIDVTTTELCDELFGGVLSAGPDRFDYLETANDGKGIPAVMSLGALDMINFGSTETVPEKYRPEGGRTIYEHNAYVTLVRTTPEENKIMAEFLAKKINKSKQPFVLLIPEGGVSAIDAPDMPFHGEEADTVLFETLEELVEQTDDRKVLRLPHGINDPEFARAAAVAFLDVLKRATVDVGGRVKTPAKSATAIVPVPRFMPSSSPGPRDDVLPKLIQLIEDKVPIVGAGAGTGISAKFEAAGGADLVIVYNSGRFRMGGHGSLAGLLPFKDANAVMLEMGEEILPVTNKTGTPLLAGVCATDPFRDVDRLLCKCREMGFAGVQNFPTVGLIDGKFRSNLEETGMGYEKEVDMVRIAREKYGLLTTPYCFDVDEARRMADAGADVIVAHMGLTTGGSIGASGGGATLDGAAATIQDIADAARSVNPDVVVLCHGGVVSMPDDAQYVLKNTAGVHGFYGASSMERLPVETAIKEQMRKFKAMEMA